MSTRGKFVVIEGLDRCGKTTQVNAIVDQLEAVEMGFPNRQTASGRICDSYLRDKIGPTNDQMIHLMFAANRWEQQSTILDTLNAGKDIICSRYSYSGVAYDMAKGMDREWCAATEVGLIEPDLIVYLDIDPSEAAKRGQYGEEKYERLAFQMKVRDSFDTILTNNEKCMRIAATLAPEKITKIILDLIKDLPCDTQVDHIKSI